MPSGRPCRSSPPRHVASDRPRSATAPAAAGEAEPPTPDAAQPDAGRAGRRAGARSDASGAGDPVPRVDALGGGVLRALGGLLGVRGAAAPLLAGVTSAPSAGSSVCGVLRWLSVMPVPCPHPPGQPSLDRRGLPGCAEQGPHGVVVGQGAAGARAGGRQRGRGDRVADGVGQRLTPVQGAAERRRRSSHRRRWCPPASTGGGACEQGRALGRDDQRTALAEGHHDRPGRQPPGQRRQRGGVRRRPPRRPAGGSSCSLGTRTSTCASSSARQRLRGRRVEHDGAPGRRRPLPAPCPAASPAAAAAPRRGAPTPRRRRPGSAPRWRRAPPRSGSPRRRPPPGSSPSRSARPRCAAPGRR